MDHALKKAKREIVANEKGIKLGTYQADITDDGKIIQLHWDYGKFTTISLQELLLSYLDTLL